MPKKNSKRRTRRQPRPRVPISPSPVVVTLGRLLHERSVMLDAAGGFDHVNSRGETWRISPGALFGWVARREHGCPLGRCTLVRFGWDSEQAKARTEEIEPPHYGEHDQHA